MDHQGRAAGATTEIETSEAEAEETAPGEVTEELSTSDGEALIELLLAGRQASEAPPARTVGADARIDGVVVGELVAFDAMGAPRVTFPGGPEEGLSARAIAALTPGDAGQAVALMFEGGDPGRPLIMGRMCATGPSRPMPQVNADGERLELSAEKEIVLRCGDASITLTRAGKILIRGAYVLSRSSGVHRIQGGSVEIN